MPPLLAASDKYSRANKRLADCKRELAKAQRGYAEAESEYLAIVSEVLRQRTPAAAGQEANSPTA